MNISFSVLTILFFYPSLLTDAHTDETSLVHLNADCNLRQISSKKWAGGGTNAYCNIYVSAIWGLVRLLFCLPSSAPRYPEEKKHFPRNCQILIQLRMFFSPPEVLAEGAGGNRPCCQTDSAILCGTERERERQAGEFFIGLRGCVWKKPPPTGCRETWEAERGREDKYRPPHSINHILLCNFTLRHVHMHACTHTHKHAW